MKMQLRSLTAVLALTLLSACVSTPSEPNPTGWWRTTEQSPTGEVSTALRLNYFNQELFGTYSNSFISAQLPLEAARLSGNTVSFELQLRTARLLYEGEFVGDELTLSSRVIDGDPIPGRPEVAMITLTRSE